MYFNLNSRLLPDKQILDFFDKLLDYKKPSHKGVPFSEYLFNRILPEYPPFHLEPISGSTLYACLGANIKEVYPMDSVESFNKRSTQIFSFPSAPAYLNPVFQTPVYWVNAYCPLLGGKKPWEDECEDYLGIFTVQANGQIQLPQIFISPERAYLTIEDFRILNEIPAEFKRFNELIDEMDSNDLFKFLLAKIFLHEFAHSLMWFPAPNGERWQPNFRFVEESLANYITLNHFYCAQGRSLINNSDESDSGFRFAKAFMSIQSPPYRAALLLWQAFGQEADELAYFWKQTKTIDFEEEPVSFFVLRTQEGKFEYRMRDRQDNLIQSAEFSGMDLPLLPLNEEIVYWRKPLDEELKGHVTEWAGLCCRLDGRGVLDSEDCQMIRETFLRVLGIQRWDLPIPLFVSGA